MLLFPSVTGRTMFRTLLPYMLGFLAVLAILTGYLHFTSKAADRVVMEEREHSILTAKSITAVLLDRDLAPAMFELRTLDGVEYLGLRARYLGLFGAADFQLFSMPHGAEDPFPFEEDSLAMEAMNSMEPVTRYLRTGKEENLLLLYPMSNLAGDPAIARIVFTNVFGGSSLIGSRYSIFLLSAAVILLVLLPGLFLKLAEIRRQIEKTGFYRTDSEMDRDRSVETVRSEVSPLFLLDGGEFPALFRLDENGSIMYMNISAERLTDLSRDDMSGALFHELPCFSDQEREGIVYPDDGNPSEFTLSIITGTDSGSRASFRMERLGRTGYGVSAAVEDPAEDAGPDTEITRDVTGSSNIRSDMRRENISRVMAMLHDGRNRFRNDESAVEFINDLYDLLAGSEGRPGTGDEDTSETIELFSELDAISSALNDVLPDRASVELDVPGLLPEVECTRQDFTQLVKNMVFYSLETNSGPVRIRLGARDVPSPVSDSVFSANCDRTVSRSVSLSYSDGTRIPVVLKEALMDPETDLSGIRRDFGSHISSVATILSRLDCHPVFTEGTTGTTLNILLRISESFLFDQSQGEELHKLDLGDLKLAVCDASRSVRESVSEALSLFGPDVMSSSDLDEMRSMISERGGDYLVLDRSAVLDPLEEALEDLGRDFPGLRVILTGAFQTEEVPVPESMERKLRVLEKPYSVDDILNIVELTMPGKNIHERPMNIAGRDV